MSGYIELSFNGKVPIGDSYVKINEDGDIALRITDGKYYVSKDYDELGVILADNEESALTREELAIKVEQLESTLQTLQGTVTTNNETLTSAMENTDTKITNNTNFITNLTNKDNTNNVFLKTYPIGSIYITTSAANPSEVYGGTWESYGSGRTLVGVDTTQTEFNTVNKIGGSKEMQKHSHQGIYFSSISEGSVKNI